MPVAALTPVLNDLLHKEGMGSSSYPQRQSLSITTDSANVGPITSDYLRHSSLIPQQLSSSSATVDDVSKE